MNKPEDFAPLVLKLLKGPVYYDDADWNKMVVMQREVSQYLGKIGLELSLSESDGFAYISQGDSLEENLDQSLPRLVPRRALSFEVSLLAVLLREELERFDPDKSESARAFITRSQLRERIRVYFPDAGDEIRLFRELDGFINTLVKLRFIRVVTSELGKRLVEDPRYEIMPIIKARVDPAFVQEFKEKLEAYGHTISGD